jgi:hypothetical protein
LIWFLFTSAFLLIITMANSQSSLANTKTLVTMIEARVANLTHARWVYQAGLSLLAHFGADDASTKVAEGVAAIAEIDVLLAQFQEDLTELFYRINKKKDDDNDDDDFNGTTGEGVGGGGSGGLAAAA